MNNLSFPLESFETKVHLFVKTLLFKKINLYITKLMFNIKKFID